MRNEYQIKFPGSLDPQALLNMGAQILGSVTQEDTYLSNKNGSVCRIRREGEHYLYTNKKDTHSDVARIREVDEIIIPEEEALDIIKRKGVLVSCFKDRKLYLLDGVSIAQDDVSHLGQFIEIRSSKGLNELVNIADKLGLNISHRENRSHLEMMMELQLPYYVQFVMTFHEKIGEYIFGITSGILTTLGLLIGVNSATANVMSVISAILTIAIADSFSDANGMYSSKISERGTTHSTALRYALGTFMGKFLLSLMFIIPIILFGLYNGVIVNIIWGISFLALVNAEQAIISGRPVFKYVLKRSAFTVTVLIFCYYAGIILKSIFHT